MKKTNLFNPVLNCPNIIDMTSVESSKAKVQSIVETIEYIPNSVVIKTILNRSTGNICAMSFDTGEGITDRILAYDTFVQIIDGKAEIMIEGNLHCLESGQGIIIPAHMSNTIKSNERFKMLLTSIKAPMNRKTHL